MSLFKKKYVCFQMCYLQISDDTCDWLNIIRIVKARSEREAIQKFIHGTKDEEKDRTKMTARARLLKEIEVYK